MELCPATADDAFGPRIDVHCRQFDFTLLFEDVFFIALPAVIFLLAAPIRLWTLWRLPPQVRSHRMAILKLILLTSLLFLNVAFVASRAQEPRLQTTWSTSSGVIAAATLLLAGPLSYLEHQRSMRPSDLLVLYFSSTGILYLPTLRTLWQTPGTLAPRLTWTFTFINTILLVFLESARKRELIRPPAPDAIREQIAGFWSRGFLSWVLPFLRAGNSQILDLSGIPEVDRGLQEISSWSVLNRKWTQPISSRHRLLAATLAANKWILLSAIPPRLALSAFRFCLPFFIEAAVAHLDSTSKKTPSDYYGYGLIGACGLIFLGIALSRALYSRQINRLMSKTRAGLIAMIYRHMATLRACDIKDSPALTLMGTDVERIIEALRLFHELWAAVPEVAVAVWLLARQISWACIAPLIVCLLSVTLTFLIAINFGPAQKLWVEKVQDRIRVTATMLSGMKAVKMLGYTAAMENLIDQLRKTELHASEKFRRLLVWQILLGNGPAMIAPFVTFGLYAVVAVVSKDQTLLSSQAFASLSLVGLMTAPLIAFCQAVPAVPQAAACFGRIQEFCLRSAPPLSSTQSTTVSRDEEAQPGMSLKALRKAHTTEHALFSFHHAKISWSLAAAPVISDLSLSIPLGLTAVIGPVGSGKSTLLWSLIGETIVQSGTITACPAAAFCSQTPWIMDDTLRLNITGGLEFDRKWYDFAVFGCCLDKDMAAMANGDLTAAGSNGASLSGGQRQRLALARAVYSRLPVVILDDALSGLDPATAGTILSRLFGRDGHFRKAGISVVIATHSREVLQYMDSVIILEGGQLVYLGKPEAAHNQGIGLEKLHEVPYSPTDHGSEATNPKLAPSDTSNDENPARDVARRQTARQEGSWAVYGYYCRSARASHMVLWMTCTITSAIAVVASTLWLQHWADANEQSPNQNVGFYVGILALFMIIANLMTAGELWFFFVNIINDTAIKLHFDLLRSTMKAPLSLFQTTDVGTITNRFSQDMDLIDMKLPAKAAQFATGAASCVVELAVLCVVGKYLAASIPVLLGTLYIVQRYYLRTSRQVRLIDIEAKAPLYKHFIETASGVATLRAFGWDKWFCRRNQEMLDQSQSPYYMLLCIQQWLALVLDLIVGGLAVILVAIAMTSNGAIGGGSLGVALVLVLQFNINLAQTIQSWTALETSVGAVARVRDFVNRTPSEASGHISGGKLDPNWPSQGGIDFSNVVARYSTQEDPVLHGLSLTIPAGEKIAIVGSSGSGKTSTIMSLLRLIEVTTGRITVDGVDLAGFLPNEIAARLNVVPQEPFFLPGSVRFNFNPRGELPDAAIEEAIRKVGLWEKLDGNKGLDTELAASEWSHGERQLLCLARALTSPSKILILDEATSSVDDETETIMQGVIDCEFKAQTVIAVVHRFKHIHKFDRVAVLKKGVLVECDSPHNLMGQDSEFRRLYNGGH
ncbi:P-loop containing nucleoside triphosphate hydrolase protein [Triangularia verruculosa]|uniref:P-loop containing nucleoside triphosphate hydrolase protein n=1 Tax=Triangularia verruculosa TaxID=2587418 RepID=A0AAN6XQ95_9PEZI|nr:P-loop containing nucleoside triphosphate hydrolase protein [Triangularia verruculosa]